MVGLCNTGSGGKGLCATPYAFTEQEAVGTDCGSSTSATRLGYELSPMKPTEARYPTATGIIHTPGGNNREREGEVGKEREAEKKKTTQMESDEAGTDTNQETERPPNIDNINNRWRKAGFHLYFAPFNRHKAK